MSTAQHRLVCWLAKEAAALTTVKSRSVPLTTEAGRQAAQAALHDPPTPASHHAATRYGRKVTR